MQSFIVIYGLSSQLVFLAVQDQLACDEVTTLWAFVGHNDFSVFPQLKRPRNWKKGSQRQVRQFTPETPQSPIWFGSTAVQVHVVNVERTSRDTCLHSFTSFS